MSRKSAKQMLQPLEPVPGNSVSWAEVLAAAFADPHCTTGLLQLAEEALRAHPGDGVILCLAATAALLNEVPARALVFLKRYARRYVPGGTWHLLQALAFAQENKLGASRALLERHGLTYPYQAMCVFPGGTARSAWLVGQVHRIMGRDWPHRRRAPSETANSARRSAATSTREAGRPRAPSGPVPTATPPAAPAEAAHDRAPSLLPIDIDIEFTAEIDLAPLVAANAGEPEPDGDWYTLRERFG
jgi:hypothetical protein